MKVPIWTPLYISALVLTSVLTAYGFAWGAAMWSVHVHNWQAVWFGIDISNTVRAVSRTELALFLCATIGVTAAMIGLVLRRRLAAYAMGAAMTCHLALWVLMADNPYYTASAGYAALGMEGITVTLTVLLVRRRVLR